MQTEARKGWVHFDGWAGRSKHPVEILGECRRKGKEHYRVRLLESAYRHAAGKILYPPKSAVTFEQQ
jgi:hypothetical protein